MMRKLLLTLCLASATMAVMAEDLTLIVPEMKAELV